MASPQPVSSLARGTLGQGTMAGIAEKGGIVYCRVQILTHFLRRNRRVDGVGCLKFDFRTGLLRAPPAHVGVLVNFMYHKIMVVDMEAFPGAPSENEE